MYVCMCVCTSKAERTVTMWWLSCIQSGRCYKPSVQASKRAIRRAREKPLEGADPPPPPLYTHTHTHTEREREREREREILYTHVEGAEGWPPGEELVVDKSLHVRQCVQVIGHKRVDLF
jgi:hypothetical protein